MDVKIGGMVVRAKLVHHTGRKPHRILTGTRRGGRSGGAELAPTPDWTHASTFLTGCWRPTYHKQQNGTVAGIALKNLIFIHDNVVETHLTTQTVA